MIILFKNKHLSVIAIWAIIALVAGSCSTQRNTWLNRNFHQINALYNGFFNARESYQRGINTLAEVHVDNFDAPLSIFKYGTPEQRQHISQDMDIAYNKAIRVIARHSMLIRNEEHNRLIDDTYFLIARAHFFRGNYSQALATFQYISRVFQAPLAQESLVWQAKVLTETGNFTDANRLLIQASDLMRQSGIVDNQANRLYYLVMADLLIRMGNPSDATTHLMKAVELTRNKKDKARLSFILGQYYLVLGEPGKASEQFGNVLRMSPEFEISFHARLSLAFSSIAAGGSPQGVKDQLQRMLRQGRYRLYQGSIYFALARMSLELNDTDAAVRQFREAARKSHDNTVQKGQSYYQLGKIYFARGDFINASSYYDSAVVFIPAGVDGSEQRVRMQNTLNQLATHLTTIQREDSLQYLARLPEADRNRIVAGIVEQMRDRENLLAARPGRAFVPGLESFGQGSQTGGGGWYFYNPTVLRFGKEEFERRFGQRQLEDFWRLSNQQTASSGFADNIQPTAGDSRQENQDFTGFSDLIENIPLTEEMFTESKTRVAEAYFAMGLVFKDHLNDLAKAAGAFQNMVNLNHSTPNTQLAFYHLVRIYMELGQTTQADTYKNMLIERYPESPFAKIFSHPDILQEELQNQNAGNQAYKLAYQAFVDKNYQLVLDKWAIADTLNLTTNLNAQFDYLKALALHQLGRREDAMDLLSAILVNYEGTIVYPSAQLLVESLQQRRLDDLFEANPETPTSPSSEDFQSVFTFNPGQVHFYIFVADTRRVDPNLVIRALENLNQSQFRDRRLTVSNVFFQQDKHLITVTSFPDKQSALDFYKNASNLPQLKSLLTNLAESFIISIDNYPVFYQEKNLTDYLLFFRMKYF